MNALDGTDLLADVLAGREVRRGRWRRFWDGVLDGTVAPVVPAGVLSAATAQLPPAGTLVGLAAALRGPQRAGEDPARGVNVVGTGGGPSTFNVSTAAALLAAACGTPVVKSGSRAYTSSLGALDLVALLGAPVATDRAGVAAAVAADGIAFAGTGVYPRELLRTARLLLPVPMTSFGALLNALGPFIADVPVGAQLTGVSGRLPWRTAQRLADAHPLPVTLCASDVGADELVSFARCVLRHPDGRTLTLEPGDLVPAAGGLDDLRPADRRDLVVEHLHDVLTGRGPAAATATVVLNAAAALVAGGGATDLRTAVATATDAVAGGAAGDLLHRWSATRAQVPA